MYPNDEYYPSQWNFHNKTEGGINVEPAWDITNGSDVIVAVLDSGITPGSDLLLTMTTIPLMTTDTALMSQGPLHKTPTTASVSAESHSTPV
jgi:hypothetical protein